MKLGGQVSVTTETLVVSKEGSEGENGSDDELDSEVRRETEREGGQAIRLTGVTDTKYFSVSMGIRGRSRSIRLFWTETGAIVATSPPLPTSPHMRLSMGDSCIVLDVPTSEI